MKLRSIVLAGLLGATALTTTGCGSVDDIINAFDIETGAVVLFNDRADVTDITVNGDVLTIAPLSVAGNYYSIVTEDDHTISITYPGASSTPSIQNNGTTYVYSPAQNCTEGYVVDIGGTDKVRVMNVSGGDVANADLNISRNGVKIDLLTAAVNCDVTTTYTGDTDGDWAVQYNGVDILGIGAFPSTSADVRVEVIIYDTTPGAEAGGIAFVTDVSL